MMIIRNLVYWRLDRFPVLPKQAEAWGNRFIKWPAIFCPAPYRRIVAVEKGIRMNLGLIDVIERSLWVHGHWDIHVMNVIQDILKPGSVFLDVGANIGFFSLIASSLVGEQGLVIAFEPSIRALQRLTLNLKLNPSANIAVVSSALGSEAGVVSLYLTNPQNTGGTTLLPRPWANREVAVSLRMDDILDEIGVVPTLIKIDVEGYEYHVLKGAEKLLKQHKPFVICEVTGYFLRDSELKAADLLGFMTEIGYRAVSLTSAERSGDPLLKCVDGQDDILFMPAGSEWKHSASLHCFG